MRTAHVHRGSLPLTGGTCRGNHSGATRVEERVDDTLRYNRKDIRISVEAKPQVSVTG